MDWHEWRNKTGEDAIMLAIRGSREEARAKFNEMLEGIMQQEDIEYRAISLLYLSSCELKAGFHEESDADLEKALSIALGEPQKHRLRYKSYKTADGQVFNKISAREFIKIEKERRQARKSWG